MIEWRMAQFEGTATGTTWTDWSVLNLSSVSISAVEEAKSYVSNHRYEYRVGDKYFSRIDDELFKIIEKELIWRELRS